VVDALRALASVSVALFHFCNQLDSNVAHVVAAYGWLGVVAVVLILWHIAAVVPGFAGQAPSYSVLQVTSHLFYLIPLTHYQWLSPVYWSLAYEFVFYITVGLTFSYLIAWNVAATVLVGLGALGVSFAVYGTADVRIVEFLVGALLMRSAVSNPGILGSAWLAGSVVLVCLIGGIATGLVVTLTAVAILKLRSLEFGRTVMFFGRMSYSLYLVHVPIGGRVINFLRHLGHGFPYEIMMVTMALLASMIAAMVLHHFVESPAIVASRKIRGFGPRFRERNDEHGL
jgi:peptidoglycan/LPS O-acetylase OafA/YrhL